MTALPFLTFTIIICWDIAVSGLICSPNQSFAHPQNCSFFYLCNENGILQLFECPKDLHFNPENRRCDWPANAKCNIQMDEGDSKETMFEIKDERKYINKNISATKSKVPTYNNDKFSIELRDIKHLTEAEEKVHNNNRKNKNINKTDYFPKNSNNGKNVTITKETLNTKAQTTNITYTKKKSKEDSLTASISGIRQPPQTPMDDLHNKTKRGVIVVTTTNKPKDGKSTGDTNLYKGNKGKDIPQVAKQNRSRSKSNYSNTGVPEKPVSESHNSSKKEEQENESVFLVPIYPFPGNGTDKDGYSFKYDEGEEKELSAEETASLANNTAVKHVGASKTLTFKN